MLGKIDKPKTMVEESKGWFDETGTLSVENQLKGAMQELENRLLEIDTELSKMTKSQKEVLGGTLESRQDSESSFIERNERIEQQIERRLMGDEEVLKDEFVWEFEPLSLNTFTPDRPAHCRVAGSLRRPRYGENNVTHKLEGA